MATYLFYNVLAFTLGIAVHYAGDLFGHDFVNSFAGSAYPSYADTLKDAASGNMTKMLYILRHMMEEKYMDSQIGDRLGSTDVSAPEKFILHTWIYNGSANNGPAKIYEKYDGMMVLYEYLIKWRTTLYNFAEKYRDDIIPSPGLINNPLYDVAARYAMTAVAVDYVDGWIEDIDKAIEQLVVAFDDIAHDLLADENGANHRGTITIVEDRLKKWIDEYGKYMAPWSDWITDCITDIANTLSAAKDWVKDQLGITLLEEAWDEFVAKLYDAAIPYAFTMVGLDYETCKALYEDYKANETGLWLEFFLETNGNMWHDLNTLNAVLKEFVTNHDKLQQEIEASGVSHEDYNEFLRYMEAFKNNPESLDAFYNTVLMGKLILMGPDNLNNFFRRYGVTSSFQNTTGKVLVDEILLEIHTAKNGSIFDVCSATYKWSIGAPNVSKRAPIKAQKGEW